MANRRMFNKNVIETEWFTDMPATTQLLYIHLSMDADDDGFVTNTKMAMVNAHASKDDMAILVAKKYVIQVERGLYLIKHWRQNNYLRNDRYKPSDYSDRLALFDQKEDGSYTLKNESEMLGIPNGYQKEGLGETGYTQNGVYPEEVRLDSGKVRLKIELDKTRYKQASLCEILIESGFVSIDEMKDPCWDNLMNTFVKEHGYLDTKIKLKYFLSVTCHIAIIGEDKQEKPIFGKRYVEDHTIGDKYTYMYASMTSSFEKFDQEQSNETGK